MSRCDYHMFDKQYNIPVIFFFALGIMHKKLIFIYLMIPNVWGEKYLTAHIMSFTYVMPMGNLQSNFVCNLGVFTYIGVHCE